MNRLLKEEFMLGLGWIRMFFFFEIYNRIWGKKFWGGFFFFSIKFLLKYYKFGDFNGGESVWL